MQINNFKLNNNMRLVQMKPVGDCSGGINLDAWVFRQVSR
jgi:hypothetical protein